MNFILLFLNLINKNLKHGDWGYWAQSPIPIINQIKK